MDPIQFAKSREFLFREFHDLIKSKASRISKFRGEVGTGNSGAYHCGDWLLSYVCDYSSLDIFLCKQNEFPPQRPNVTYEPRLGTDGEMHWLEVAGRVIGLRGRDPLTSEEVANYWLERLKAHHE